MEKTPFSVFLSNLKNHINELRSRQDLVIPSPQLNWRIRYCKVLEQNRDLFDVSKSVLEVGSGNIGIAPYLKRKVVGLEPDFSGPVSEWLEPVAGSIFEIPFADRSFDIVVCVDVLEHLSESLRPQAISELLRCARSKIVISCPCGPSAEEGERHLADVFRRTGVGVPEWLTEHLENGLPSVGNIFGTLVKIGLPFEITGNESMNQHFAGILLDIFFPFSQELHNLQASKTPFVPPVGEAEWDYYYSYLFTIHADAESRSKAHPDFTYTDLGSGDAQLYCVYHKPWPTEHLGRITPVFAGPAADSAPESALTDRLRDGPRLDNRRWSELSAYYKIWKEGPRSDIVGFCHYRRLFNFGAVGSSNRATVLSIKDLESNTDSYFDVQVLDQVRGNIVMVARPVKLNMTIWEQYALAHNIKDYCHVLNIISRRYPELMPFAVEHFNSNSLYANNMLVTCWPIFDELCTFLFHLLKDFEKIVPYDRASTYQNRDISFLAERVFDLWLRYKQSTGTKIIECPIFLIQ